MFLVHGINVSKDYARRSGLFLLRREEIAWDVHQLFLKLPVISRLLGLWWYSKPALRRHFAAGWRELQEACRCG